MLSYQHGFHAGGFADVHKHTALGLLLGHLLAKPAPFCVIDSHAGRGVYDLAGAQASKTGEWRDGIGRLLGGEPGPPPASAGLRAYLDLVRGFNKAGGLATYPGSPALALKMLRRTDRLVLVEAHPAEHAALRRALHHDRRVHIHKRDAFEALPGLVPPAERRGLVLIDPSYEVKSEYTRLPAIVAALLRRWPTGIVAIWYPILPDARHAPLLVGLDALPRPVLQAELTGPPPERGLIGTGLAVVNPPWRFAEALAEAGTEIATLLFGDSGRHTQHMSGVPA
jgi:23S rRNA (adenine2030-N6)-methyltransferase